MRTAMQNITLVTGNPNKAREVAMILGFEIATRAIDLPEIQSFSLEEIVRQKVAAAFAIVGSPVLVEDVAFHLDALKGFPGPFIKFWDKQGCHDLDDAIAKALGDDRASARSGVGYADGTQIVYTESLVTGRVTARRGPEGNGWGFDFYFIPDGYNQTFAELGMEAKNKTSHRGLAFAAMREKLADL